MTTLLPSSAVQAAFCLRAMHPKSFLFPKYLSFASTSVCHHLSAFLPKRRCSFICFWAKDVSLKITQQLCTQKTSH